MTKAWALAGLAGAAALVPAQAAAEDWRAVAFWGRDVAFVDADSVRRHADGRIRFAAELILGDRVTFADAEYDRHTWQARGDCTAGGGAPPSGKRQFYLGGGAVPAPVWNAEDVAEDAHALVRQVCEGTLGYRRFASPIEAFAEYERTRSVERLLAYVSPEVELAGTVVQGFEMSGISLCGSEKGCTAGARREFCWVEGPVDVPVPPDAANGRPMRRDTADMAFRGRILRSPTGRGFGHVQAFGCLAEALEPARLVTLPAEPEQAAPTAVPARGTAPEAVAAHEALAAAFAAGATVAVEQDGQRWTADALQPRPSDWQGACGSDLTAGGRSLDPYPTAIIWGAVDGVDVAGATLTVRASRWAGNLDFHLPTSDEAQAVAAELEPLVGRRVASVAQARRHVEVRLEDGSRTAKRYAGAAEAVRAAGRFAALIGVDAHSVSAEGARVSGLAQRRVVLGFGDAAKAERVAELMRSLSALCR